MNVKNFNKVMLSTTDIYSVSLSKSFSYFPLQLFCFWQTFSKLPERWRALSHAWSPGATRPSCWPAWAPERWRPASCWTKTTLWLLTWRRSSILPGKKTSTPHRYSTRGRQTDWLISWILKMEMWNAQGVLWVRWMQDDLDESVELYNHPP